MWMQSDYTFASLYFKLLYQLLHVPDFVTEPRGLKIHELQNSSIVLFHPTSNSFFNPKRAIPTRYLAGELLWYFTGRNDLEFISKYSKFWERIANADDTLNSAYGNLLFNEIDHDSFMTQWRWAYNSLSSDKDTRQAVMHFNRPQHQRVGNKDFVCTMYGVFTIRENKLHFTICMRSNDVFLGLTYDLPFFTLLQQQMRNLLLKHFPDLELGHYTHFANSLHMYEKDFEKIKEISDHAFIPKSLPELKEYLVDEQGKPNPALIDIINGKEIETEDELIKWISEHARSETT